MSSPKICIIRHGEKPIKGVKAVDYNSKRDENSLIVRGWQRAGGLVQLFNKESEFLCKPKYLYACYKSDHAQRALDTITPLSEFLGIKINTSIARDKEKKMAKEAMACDGPVLIAWEHNCIHLIANAILGNVTDAPQVWPDDRFDMVYVFDLQKDGSYKFSQVPQMLLVGDKPTLFKV